MTRLKEKIRIKADVAAQKAKKQVYNGIKIKKRRKRKVKGDKMVLAPFQAKWIEDPVGNQGVVFFDGHKYWLTIVSSESKDKIRNVSFAELTQEQWEKRNKKVEENENSKMDISW